nr:MAG TPA: hypothetical protein [Caudoviricetes sp.]
MGTYIKRPRRVVVSKDERKARPLRRGFSTLSRDTPHLTIVKGARIVKTVSTKSESSRKERLK